MQVPLEDTPLADRNEITSPSKVTPSADAQLDVVTS